MGYTISCDLILREPHPAHYWWPLIFEVLRYHQFSFDNPAYWPHHQGGFQWFTQEADNGDYIEAASFRTLWDAIYTAPRDGTRTIAPTFWSTSADLAGWDVVCHLSTERLSCWTFTLGPGGADLSPAQRLAEQSVALSRFVALACDLFVACAASAAEFSYEWAGVVSRFGAIGAPLALEWWASPSEHAPYEATVDEVTLSSGSTLVIVNPFALIAMDGPIPLDLRPVGVHTGRRAQHV
jgi:hypothetical protein